MASSNNNNYKLNLSNWRFNFGGILWERVLWLVLIHCLAFYGIFHCITHDTVKWQTLVCMYVFTFVSGIGITAGMHRLWSHKSFSATFPLRLLLTIFSLMSLQDDIVEWARLHRVHHKHSETDADPHNIRRGFFFAHMGWIMVEKSEKVAEKCNAVDMSDLLADPIVRYQSKFYLPLALLFWGFIPTMIPYVLFNESLITSFLSCVMIRYVYTLHLAFLVNSVAHLWGERPYDKNLGSTENDLVIYGTLGEGFHNYHHSFPWDYSTSELGWGSNFNFTTAFIDLCQWLGLAYDLKKASNQVVKGRQLRTAGNVDGKEKENEMKKFRFGCLAGYLLGFMFNTAILWSLWISRIIYWHLILP